MAAISRRLLALLLAVGLCSVTPGFADDKKKEKKSPFADTCQSLLSGYALQLMNYWHCSHLESWGRLEVEDAESQASARTFPGKLTKVLANLDDADHEAAVQFVFTYLSVARIHAAVLSEKNLALVAERALAPRTDEIRNGLLASLKARSAKTRLNAALALLCLHDNHTAANEVLRTNTAADQHQAFFGYARLHSPQVLEFLRKLLKHRDKDVRDGAASAIIMLGPDARSLVPDLIALLETGDNAIGSISFPFVMGLQEPRNLALSALQHMEEHARPAVPTILVRFPKASLNDQAAMVTCLGSIGCKEADCLALVRAALENERPKLQMSAACALLHLVPGDRQAMHVLRKGLRTSWTQDAALQACLESAPPSTEIARALLPFLDSDKEDTRILATEILGKMGKHATLAVPAIEKLLTREDDHQGHTFHSLQASARALGNIRGKEAATALLRVADSQGPGADYAISYLITLGDDLPTTAVPVLVRALRHDLTKWNAAIALANLGERARLARRDLERHLNDRTVGWILDTALRRMPEPPR